MDDRPPQAQRVTGQKPPQVPNSIWTESEKVVRRYRRLKKETEIWLLTDLGFGVITVKGFAWLLLVCLVLCVILAG